MSAPTDPTFRSYSADAAKLYATHRLSYSERLYNTILGHHAATGGQFDLLLDVGCGPGNATRDVALSFKDALGTDPGSAMIEAAKDLEGKTKSGNQIRYEVAAAEEISKVEGLKEGSVDLLIAAMAAHWFDMSKFWAEAAKLVKPGGTVALWTMSSSYCAPSTPNYDQVLKVLLRFERETLGPHELPGNRLSREMYDNLGMPWEATPTIPEFAKSGFTKLEYDRDGKLSNGKTFFGEADVSTLDEVERGYGTASMVTRWREAHPELVGTDQDVVKVFARELREALGGQDWVETCGSTAILLFKKS